MFKKSRSLILTTTSCSSDNQRKVENHFSCMQTRVRPLLITFSCLPILLAHSQFFLHILNTYQSFSILLAAWINKYLVDVKWNAYLIRSHYAQTYSRNEFCWYFNFFQKYHFFAAIHENSVVSNPGELYTKLLTFKSRTDFMDDIYYS